MNCVNFPIHCVPANTLREGFRDATVIDSIMRNYHFPIERTAPLRVKNCSDCAPWFMCKLHVCFGGWVVGRLNQTLGVCMCGSMDANASFAADYDAHKFFRIRLRLAFKLFSQHSHLCYRCRSRHRVVSGCGSMPSMHQRSSAALVIIQFLPLSLFSRLVRSAKLVAAGDNHRTWSSPRNRNLLVNYMLI